MASTYEKIATTTLSSAELTIVFTSIPNTYTDLVLIFNGIRSSGGDLDLTLQFNSDTGSNYSDTEIRGYTNQYGTYGSFRNSNQTFIRLGVLTLDRTTLKTNIMSYSNTNIYKSIISRQNSINADYGLNAKGCLWRSTSAISTVTIGSGAGNIASGSTATLYGIKAE